jgi:hypothetical protein
MVRRRALVSRWSRAVPLLAVPLLAATCTSQAPTASPTDSPPATFSRAPAAPAPASARHVPQRPAAALRPRVTGPITGGDHGRPFGAVPSSIARDHGYLEDEYFIAGQAVSYRAEGA